MTVDETIKRLYLNKDDDKAAGMQSYMRNQFAFLGMQKIKRASLQNEFIKESKKMKKIDWDVVYKLWELPEREFQYFAIDYLLLFKDKLVKQDMIEVENLLKTKPWWDTIDILSSQIIGGLCKNYPELVEEYILPWADSESLWLIRSSILFQLKYKGKTDVELLEFIIKRNSMDSEFFIAKAIGWILREYSKTDALWVKTFIESHDLQKISIREGSKYL
ncbi:MAG: DNA alkylation repair protein [Clostridiales bacterium]|nr:DNA alkylation repair protein [Clostridiales bacterium]